MHERKLRDGQSEQERIKRIVSPMVARLAYSDTLSPLPQNISAEILRERTIHHLNLARTEAASNASRNLHWKKEGQPTTYAGQIEKWHKGIKNWLDKQDSADETITQALQSLGLNLKRRDGYTQQPKQF